MVAFKTVLKASIIFLLLASIVHSQEIILAVDYDETHAEYIIELDDVEYGPIIPIEINIDANETLIMDIHDLITPGRKHKIRALALNPWGDESEWSDPFDFFITTAGAVVTRSQVNRPVVLRLILR